MAKTLGSLASGRNTTGSQLYFVSMAPRLVSGETLTGTPTVTTTATDIEITDVANNTEVLASADESIYAPIGKAVEFRITASKNVVGQTRVPLVVKYITDESNTDFIETSLIIDTTVKT